MTSNTIDRKIAVVLVADVVGYSKHMEKNEEATLASYSECEKIFKILFIDDFIVQFIVFLNFRFETH